MARCSEGSLADERALMASPRSWLGCFGVVLASVGCGSDHAPVSGVVTFNGKPVPNATVTFKPRDGDKFSFGVTDANGAYALKVAGTAEGMQRGAKIGEHDVKIVAIESTAQAGAGSPAGLGSLVDVSNGPARIKYLLPRKYHEYSTSGLEYRVVSGGHRDANFALGE